ncbi:MAG: hypothetical protein ACOCW1_04185 [Chitinispirillaceae bacterium]
MGYDRSGLLVSDLSDSKRWSLWRMHPAEKFFRCGFSEREQLLQFFEHDPDCGKILHLLIKNMEGTMNGEPGIVIRLNARKTVFTISVVACLVILASIAGQLYKYLLGNENYPNLINEFYIDAEANIPTFFNSLILLVTSMLLGVIYACKRHRGDVFRFHWLLLGAAFLFLAVDESTLIYHDLLSGYLTQLTGELSGTFRAVFGVLFVLFFYQIFRFFRSLSVRYRVLFAICAALYISGAVGMDHIGTQYHEIHGKYNLAYSMLATVEMLLETAGIILFIHALSKYLSAMVRDGSLKNSNPQPSQRTLRKSTHSETT